MPTVTLPTPLTGVSLTDAQYKSFKASQALTAAIVSQDKWGLAQMNNILENDPSGLTPQQVADGIQARSPGYCVQVVFQICAYTIQGLGGSGNLTPDLWLKRVWLPVADGSVIATQVPWNPLQYNGLPIYATQELAIEASHTLLAAWITANTVNGVVPTSPVAFANAL